MVMRFTVLASGSSGNASLLEVDGFGLLVDAGLGPRLAAARLATVGASWAHVRAVLLTHTHGDHWNERTLAHLVRYRIPVYCHDDHHDDLDAYSRSFGTLRLQRLVHPYGDGQTLSLHPGLRCRGLALRHDGGTTFGFRFEGAGWALAYLADLGSWTQDLARAAADVDVLALEFNHDVAMEYASGRSPRLIARVLGDHGHLSNEQAAGFVRAVLRLSAPGRLRHLIQLHLSRDCNHPELAASAAREAVDGLGYDVNILTACQGRACAPVRLGSLPGGAPPAPPPARKRSVKAVRPARQVGLPGLEDVWGEPRARAAAE